MGILTAHMQQVVREQRLGFVATVCPDGTPNLSPKGTTAVLDDDHLVFADIWSPGTVDNLRRNPWIEINVVDPVARKGYRFKGHATVLDGGPLNTGRRVPLRSGTQPATGVTRGGPPGPTEPARSGRRRPRSRDS